jgi:hypothetical protein
MKHHGRSLRSLPVHFYYFMDLPGIGEVGDQWDLRKTIDDYFGHFGFSGKRVLDVGVASDE